MNPPLRRVPFVVEKLEKSVASRGRRNRAATPIPPVHGIVILFALAGPALGLVHGADCNQNGVDDSEEIASLAADDCNGNGVPDECDTRPTLTFDVSTVSVPGGSGVGERGAIVVADLDRDGLDEILRTPRPDDPDNGIRVLRRTANGDLDLVDRIEFVGRPIRLAAADLDSNGFLDIVALVFRPTRNAIALRRQRADGNFTDTEIYETLGCVTDFDVGDIDGDGDSDMVAVYDCAEDRNGVQIFRSLAPGAAAPPRLEREEPFFIPRYSNEISLVDIDLDGHADIVNVLTGRDEVWIHRNAERGSTWELDFVRVGSAPVAAVFADFDGDGLLDLATADDGDFGETSTVSVARARVPGRFHAAIQLEAPPDTRLVAAADFDGDARSDLAVVDHHEPAAQLIVARGNGSFEPGPRLAFTEVNGSDAVADVSSGDVDGDGRVDLVFRMSDSLVIARNTTPASEEHDCDRNGVLDSCEGPLPDCDEDGLPDACERDCDGDGVPDDCAIAQGNSPDCDGNGLPDVCDPDCDGNGFPDACDIAREPELDCDENRVLDSCEILSGARSDLDRNGIPDNCEDVLFRRGDSNDNGTVEVADASAIFLWLFLGRFEIRCLEAADTNGSAAVDLSDGITVLGFLFLGAPPPPHPFPDCGRVDPSSGSTGLGCEEYRSCSGV
jgi:hypothetical protein